MKKGFTLIELLVVVLIIGILSAIALPQYNKAVWKSRLIEIPIRLKHIQNATDLYLLENGNPSTSLNIGKQPDLFGLDDLNCNTYGVCSSKYVAYSGDCSSNGSCTIGADWDEEDKGLGEFVLYYERSSQGGWTRRCAMATSSFAGDLCTQLKF